MEPLLSVVILTRNARQDAKPCLDSVLKATVAHPTEIIVVDNGSTDETRTILDSYGEQLNLIPLGRNHGVAVARNIGMRAAKGRLIWILDVDTVVNRTAVDGMIRYLTDHPECGICACRLQSEGGEVQDSCRRLPLPKHKLLNLLQTKTERSTLFKNYHNKIKTQNEAQFYHKEWLKGEPFEAEYVIGACQLFRRTLLEEVGYLDERIFYGPEDADFCLRVYQKGYRIVCLPQCHIIHHYNRISGRRLFSRLSFHHLKGLSYFYNKHHLFTSDPYRKQHG
jgi:GT2 family glycosyltransferase